ncbi:MULTISPECIES: DUF3300 domain-containing protein [unclassified Rhizobium]|uniref:DUF3300 domain-containing protein n=1 Tax=unclassified Rhizobium TaxID=2613769 RepID=UPI0009E74483|nr:MULTISPECIES: DUF3300 domain-containing protein [unclassified Rhizobium]
MFLRYCSQRVPAIALLALLTCPITIASTAAQDKGAATAGAADTEETQPRPLSEDELEILVARIALYPDELVAVVTSASLYPLQIVEAVRFLEQVKKDAKLQPKDTWDGSVISLLNYPQIVMMMSDDLDWTQSLGEALSYQQQDVLLAIQQLRNEAVADGVIKTNDKIMVTQENDNVVITSVSPEKIYVPQYAPEMLYEPDYVVAPISYYPDPYPNYYYPTATFFAGAVTGAIWAATVDWDHHGVWGGGWYGDVDIDCNNCFNNINGKVNINDVDWKNVDRNKIKIDNNQFNKVDRTSVRNSIEANGNNSIKAKANVIGNDRSTNIRNNSGNVSVKDVRNSKIEKSDLSRAKVGNNDGLAVPGKKPAQAAQNRKPDPKLSKQKANFDRPKTPSALGRVDSGRRTEMQSNRGRQAMGGGNRGGGGEHREIKRGGGRHR